MKCETCIFSSTVTLDNGSGDLRLCRRNAPIAIPVADEQEKALLNIRKNVTPISAAVWPVVHSDDWCGEYKSEVR